MLIVFILTALVIGAVVYFVKKNPTYSPEQEAQELLAKAKVDVGIIAADAKADVSKVETTAKSDLSKL
jgi:acyl-coenzyme A synthetase/AMP-(fatty) acid ligase